MSNDFETCDNFAPKNRFYEPEDIGHQACRRMHEEVSAPPVIPAKDESKFHGLNLGIIKLGYMDHGSLALGVNVGIAKVDTQVGLQNRVDAGVGLGPIGARGGVGVGIGENGLQADVGAGARATEQIKANADFGAGIGPKTGVNGDVGAKVGPLHTAHVADLGVSEAGFNNGYRGDVGIARIAGVGAGAHANLNENSSIGAGSHVRLGDASLGVGTDITTGGNSYVRPGVHIDAGNGPDRTRFEVAGQVGPKFDARIGTGFAHINDMYGTENGAELTFGVGQSGLGFRATEKDNGYRNVRALGVGPDYNSEWGDL